jgi:hypothetical protein
MGWHVGRLSPAIPPKLTPPTCSKTVPILGSKQEVLVLLAGRPSDPSYVEDLKDLEGNMHVVRLQLHFPQEHQNHRRGAYPTKSTGISYGGGSKVTASLLPLTFCS